MVTMPLITPSILAQTVATEPLAPASQLAPADAVSGFNASLERVAAAGARAPASNQAQAPTPALAIPDISTEGDAILGGLQRLRGTFDAQQSRIAELMNGPVTDINTMLAMQMEMTNYSILIDMTSKLASKAAQGLDTLMKG